MKVSSTIRFIDNETRRKFFSLEKGDDSNRKLFYSISKVLDDIENDAFSGIQITKKLIPRSYILKYQVRNLWKINLPKGHRLLYSVLSKDEEVICLIIEWLNHKDYERRFDYG